MICSWAGCPLDGRSIGFPPSRHTMDMQNTRTASGVSRLYVHSGFAAPGWWWPARWGSAAEGGSAAEARRAVALPDVARGLAASRRAASARSRRFALVVPATILLVGGLALAACSSPKRQASGNIIAKAPRLPAIVPNKSGSTQPASTPVSPSAKPSGPVSPGPLTYGAHGTLYVADPTKNQVWARTASGVPKLIAGNGTLGISGMGGPATSAELSRPQELAKIGSTLYIVDSGANRVVAVRASDVIHVVAGNGAVTGLTAAGGPALSSAIGPNVFGLARGPRGSLYIASANEILELQGSTLSVVLSEQAIKGIDPMFPDASQCMADSVTPNGAGNLYFVCNNVHGLFEQSAGGSLSYRGQYRSYGVASLSEATNGAVLGATGGVVSITGSTKSVTETFPERIADLGAFEAQHVAESPTRTFVADQPSHDGIGRRAIVTFTLGSTPTILWPA